MVEKVVIFGKQTGEPRVPLTVRVDWFPDGTIKPLMYWMPDGTCYKVTHLSESIPIAFLRDGGAGMRFKVQSEVVATPDVDDERLHTKEDTILYLADKRFHQKNMIDGRYGHAGKEYIAVTMDVFPDGDYELVFFWVHGMRYIVEATADIEPRGSFQTGGVGLWHRVEARLVNADDDEDPNPDHCIRRFAALYLELNKWFVSTKP